MSSICAMAILVTLASTAWAQCLSISKVGGENDLSDGVTFQTTLPAVAYNSVDDEYMVAWFDLRNQPTTGNDIYAQLVGADGIPFGEDIEVALVNDAQIDPYIAHGPVSNEYLITYRTQEGGFFNNGRGRRIAADGTPQGGDFFVANAGFESSIAYSPVQEDFLYLARNFAGGGPSGIRGMLIEDGGLPFGPDIGVATAGAPAPCGHVAYDSTNDRFLCTWRDQTNSDLRGQVVNSDGTLEGGFKIISPDFPSSGRAATQAYDPDNNRFLVVYGQFTGPDIVGRFVDESGDALGDEFTIVTTGGNQASPFVARSSTTGGYVIVHNDQATVRVLLLDGDGALVDGSTEIAAGFANSRPHLTENTSTGEMLIVWSDNRNQGMGIQDIFCQVVQISNQDPGDFNGDGVKNILDFVAFQEAFVAGDPSADCDQNGSLDILDFVCFQALFQGGCG